MAAPAKDIQRQASGTLVIDPYVGVIYIYVCVYIYIYIYILVFIFAQ